MIKNIFAVILLGISSSLFAGNGTIMSPANIQSLINAIDTPIIALDNGDYRRLEARLSTNDIATVTTKTIDGLKQITATKINADIYTIDTQKLIVPNQNDKNTGD